MLGNNIVIGKGATDYCQQQKRYDDYSLQNLNAAKLHYLLSFTKSFP
jgi:hypothetical protein